jgi:hypothetical protein
MLRKALNTQIRIVKYDSIMYDKQEGTGNLKFCLSREASRFILILFLSSVFAITITLCIPKQASAALTSPIHVSTNTIAANSVHLLTYQNSTFGISMRYPSNWQKMQITDIHEKESHDNDKVIVEFKLPLSSVATSNKPGKGQEDNQPTVATLTILLHKLPAKNIIDNLYSFFDKTASQKISLESFVLSHFTSLFTKFHDFHLIKPESGEITLVDNTPAHMLVYTYGEQEQQRKIVLKTMEILTVKDDEGYIIKYLAEEPRFFDYLPSIQKIVNSFGITR